jgi:hypothetical protein
MPSLTVFKGTVHFSAVFFLFRQLRLEYFGILEKLVHQNHLGPLEGEAQSPRLHKTMVAAAQVWMPSTLSDAGFVASARFGRDWEI